MIWLDAHLSPNLATWLTEDMDQPTAALRDLGLRDAKDSQIFAAARKASAILMIKDADFVDMVERIGPPPAVIWLTCGNTSNRVLREILHTTLLRALALINAGEWVVEISDSKSG